MAPCRKTLRDEDQDLLELEPDALLRVGSTGSIDHLHLGQGSCRELFLQTCAGAHLNDSLPEAFTRPLLEHLRQEQPDSTYSHEISWRDRTFVLNSHGTPDGGLRVMIRDVTLYKAAENTLRELAYQDSLTGLPNRSFFKQNFEAAIESARSKNKRVCVLFIDLDRFKRINDTLGHKVGDELLVEVASRLRRSIRSTDLLLSLPPESVARLGGDEFTIVADNLDSTAHIKVLAQRLLDSLAKPIQVGEYELVTTPSIGISVYPGDGQDADTLLKHADVAMYHAKHQGRNNYQFFSSVMNEKTHRRLTLESQLRVAIENGDLHLEYQPQINLTTMQVAAVESLARWHHQDLGTITPDVFIPVAEESGLIVPLGDMLMELGCEQLRNWQEQGLNDFRLAMNFSGLQFRRDHIVKSLQGLLERYQLPPARLELEITEAVIARDAVETANTLRELRELGIKLTIDDFGSGYSSLKHLSEFALDAVKIDRDFTAGLCSCEVGSASVADAILAIAQQLNLEVIAEGVETQCTLEYLQARGCKAAQGYYFSRPLDAISCTAFIERTRLEAGDDTLPLARAG